MRRVRTLHLGTPFSLLNTIRVHQEHVPLPPMDAFWVHTEAWFQAYRSDGAMTTSTHTHHPNHLTHGLWRSLAPWVHSQSAPWVHPQSAPGSLRPLPISLAKDNRNIRRSLWRVKTTWTSHLSGQEVSWGHSHARSLPYGLELPLCYQGRDELTKRRCSLQSPLLKIWPFPIQSSILSLQKVLQCFSLAV